jgi:murein DD-endopeptidase MepM/ murein hydrolase activator NlpD
VSLGQQVNQGTILGPSGTTGYSTGVHLHFEVQKDGIRVNPLGYLPPIP